jgi:plastocyanin
MQRSRPRFLPLVQIVFAFAALAALDVYRSRAGEVRINITGNSVTGSFSPRTTNINAGDHVIWVWSGGQHTTTSGDSATGTADSPNHWDTPILLSAGTNTPAFCWQSAGPEVIPFFCQLHAPAMAGRVIVGSGIHVADFRLTEVQYNEASGFDKFEITNLGTVIGDLGRYRFALGATVAAIASTSLPIAPGGTMTIHTHESGTNTATDVFLPALGAMNDVAGSVALYAPNTVTTNLDDATQILDFVEWGAGGQENEATAVAAGEWTAGATAPTVPVGHTIAFCGTTAQHAGAWYESQTPSFSGGSGNCSAVPSRVTTWGRIKTLYR